MAGHSKWAQIKRQKAVTDQKRSALFAKLGHAITIAAREGGGDLDSNFSLRLAVDTAKSANMPKDNIERAIKRGTGELGGGELFELTYEAVVAGGVGIIIKTLTDNKNRTASEIKHLLSKHNSSLGAPGSVSWQFNEFGIIRLLKPSADLDEFILKVVDYGALDVEEQDDMLIIKTEKSDLQQVQERLEKDGIKVQYAEIDLTPDTYIPIDDATIKKLQTLFEALDEAQDVVDYYVNANLDSV